MNIHILCGNAAFNKGDRGNLLSQQEMLTKAFPNATITYDSYRPEVDKDWYPAKVVPRGWVLSWAQIRQISKADFVVWGGGALIADNAFRLLVPLWTVIILFVRYVLRKPVMAWAHGVILDTAFARFFAKIAYNCCDMITVRDENSLRAIRQLKGLRPKVEKTADPGILVSPNGAERGLQVLRDIGIDAKEKIIAISPTYWPFYHKGSEWLPMMLKAKFKKANVDSDRLRSFNAALTKLAKGLAEDHNATVLLLPRYPCAPWRDVEFLKDVASRAQPKGGRVVVFEKDIGPAEYLSMYHHFSLLLSTALHDAIFATAVDRPCVKLYYELKGKDFFESIDAKDRLHDWQILFEPGGVEQILETAKNTMRDWDQHHVPKVIPRKQEMVARAQANLDFLHEMIESLEGQKGRRHVSQLR